MVIGQPVEIAESVKKAVRVAMCPLDPFRLAGQRMFLSFPRRVLFRERSLVVHEPSFPTCL